MNEAYLCLVTWPDGVEGLLFPRPGNVPIASTLIQGMADFTIARKHLDEFTLKKPNFKGTSVRLVRLREVETLTTYKVA